MQAGAKISALAPRCPGGWREDPGRIMEIKLVVWRGCHYVTVHIQSRAAMNCNHSIIFNTLSLGHKLSKIKKKKYILAAPRVHFPDGLSLLLPDLASALSPASEDRRGAGGWASPGPRRFRGAAGRPRESRIGLRALGARILIAFRFN